MGDAHSQWHCRLQACRNVCQVAIVLLHWKLRVHAFLFVVDQCLCESQCISGTNGSLHKVTWVHYWRSEVLLILLQLGSTCWDHRKTCSQGALVPQLNKE